MTEYTDLLEPQKGSGQIGAAMNLASSGCVQIMQISDD